MVSILVEGVVITVNELTNWQNEFIHDLFIKTLHIINAVIGYTFVTLLKYYSSLLIIKKVVMKLSSMRGRVCVMHI